MRLSAALVPDLANFFEIVIFLGIVRAVVAELAEVNRVHFEAGRQAGHAPHVFRAGGWRVNAGDDRRPGWGANRRSRAGPGVAEAAFGQAVKVWRDGVRVAVAAKVRPVVLAGDPEDVRQRLIRPRLALAKRGHGAAPQEYSTDSAHD